MKYKGLLQVSQSLYSQDFYSTHAHSTQQQQHKHTTIALAAHARQELVNITMQCQLTLTKVTSKITTSGNNPEAYLAKGFDKSQLGLVFMENTPSNSTTPYHSDDVGTNHLPFL